MKGTVLVVALALVALQACSQSRSPEAGSQTHFLTDCDGSCAAPYSCLCGVCTRACTGQTECAEASDDATCVAPSSSADSCSSAKVCDVECNANADCAALGSAFSCQAGRCREKQSGSAGASASGSAGQSGGGGVSAGGSGGAAAVGLPPAGAGGVSGGECSRSSDCALVGTGCCAACVPTKDDYVAVLRSEEDATRRANCPSTVACGPCPPPVYDPMAPVVRAACMAGRCEVVDLREEPQTECMLDDECEPTIAGCCDSCQVSGWIGKRKAVDFTEFAPYCPAPTTCATCASTVPEAFCASDGHCAVREPELLNGTLSTTCYSPTQNLEHAYDADALGCDCNVGGFSVCRRDSTGRDVALTCDTQWQAIQDGPCGV